MTCPRITRAIKSSRLPAPLKHTLTVMTDHINSWKDPTGQADHTRPATLDVYEAVATLAADTGYSKSTVMVHLWKLRGYTPIPDQPKKTWPQDGPWAVLTRTKQGRQWQADRYQLDLEALEALADLTRVQTPARDRQRSSFLTAEPMETKSSDTPQRSRNLTAELAPAVKFSTFSGQETLPEYSHSLPTTTEIPFLSESNPDPAPTPPEKKGSSGSRSQAKTKPPTKTPARTPPPEGEAQRQLIEDLKAWAAASEDHAPGVNVARILNLWLFNCAAKHYAFLDWYGEAKTQLRTAYLDAQEQAHRHGHRPGTPVRRELTPEEARIEALLAPAAPAADDHEWADPRANSSMHAPCKQVHQRGAPCPARPAATATDTGPPPESSAFHQRQVVQTAEDHGFAGVGALVAAVVTNGNGNGPHAEQENPESGPATI